MTMTFAINGGEVEVPDGASVLEVALSPGDGEKVRRSRRRVDTAGLPPWRAGGKGHISEKMRVGEVFVPIGSSETTPPTS